jgi:hypothetical protein
MQLLLQAAPIVVDVVQQPAVTQEITYPQVILGAVGVAGGIMLLAALVGLITGVVIIALKKRGEAAAGPIETGHARLRI